MARYNTALANTSTTTTATLASPGSGAFTNLGGTAPYTVTVPDPALFPGQMLSYYNSTAGTITLSAPAGVFNGTGGSTASTQALTTGSTAILVSDGTNYVILVGSGGAITGTTGTFSSTIAANGSTGITTTQTTFPLVNATATTINFGGDATTMSIGKATGTATFNGTLAIATGKTLQIGGATVLSKTALTLNGSSSGTVVLQAAAAAGSATYTWPSADASVSGYALVSNASGTLSWAAAGATVSDDSSTTTLYPTFFTATSGAATTLKVSSSKMSFNASTGTLTVTAITESSSRTLKMNINPIDNALETVLKLKGVTYDRKDGSSQNEAGLIAEQVNKILPNLVSKDEKGKPTGIHYTKLTAYLIEAIKVMQSEINDLSKQLKKTNKGVK
jgi:hypothetical protein